MGFLDFLKGPIQCPFCGTQGARQKSGSVRCPNPNCMYFDTALAQRAGGAGQPVITARPASVQKTFHGDFAPVRAMAIRYRNFEGQEKTFTADAESAERRKHHLVVRVAPTGQHLSLARDRILNLAEVESAFTQRVAPEQDWPTPRERQVLNYHKKHRSSSPLYEKIRAKYPNW